MAVPLSTLVQQILQQPMSRQSNTVDTHNETSSSPRIVLSLIGMFSCERRPIFLKARSSKWLILTCVTVATFTDIFIYGIIIPVIPFSLNSRVGIREEDVQYWVSVLLAVYGAALMVTAPLWGWMADRIAVRRFPLILGLLCLAAGTALLAAGNNVRVLIAGRILQGASGAVVWVGGCALLVDTVGQVAVGQMMGFVAASLSVALLLAPMLGGIVADRGGYEAVFGMCWGCIGIDIILRLIIVEKKVAAKWLGLEGAYGTRVIPAAPSAMRAQIAPGKEGEAIDKGQEKSTEAEAVTEIALPYHSNSIPYLANLPIPNPAHVPPPLQINLDPNHRDPQQRPWRERFPPFVLLSSPRLLASLYACLIQSSILTALDTVIPVHVRNLFHWSAMGAGLIFLSLTIPTLFNPFVGYWIDRKGPRLAATLCFVLGAPFLVLLRLVNSNTVHEKAALAALLFGIGATIGVTVSPIMAEMSHVVVEIERKRPGIFGEQGAMAQAYGLFNVSFAGGCLIGPTWGGFVKDKAGWGTMSWTLGLLAITTAVPVFALVGGPVWKRKRRESNTGEVHGV